MMKRNCECWVALDNTTGRSGAMGDSDARNEALRNDARQAFHKKYALGSEAERGNSGAVLTQDAVREAALQRELALQRSIAAAWQQGVRSGMSVITGDVVLIGTSEWVYLPTVGLFRPTFDYLPEDKAAARNISEDDPVLKRASEAFAPFLRQTRARAGRYLVAHGIQLDANSTDIKELGRELMVLHSTIDRQILRIIFTDT